MKNINCNSGAIPNTINEKVFKEEISLCKKLSKKNDGKCCWGNCNSCGVIPFLYKLHKGEIIDDKDEIKNLKDKFLK